MAEHLVSVVVPSFNKAPFIRETLDSVLRQEDVTVEVIVVDDVSTDGSWDIISEYGDRVSAHRLPNNRGSTYTRNYGATHARGRYIMFLDADDVLAPSTLRALRDTIRGTTRSVAACRWRKLHRERAEWVPSPSGKPLIPPSGDYVRSWLAGWYFPPCAILWPRELYDETGGWGEMGPWDDREIMIRTLLRGTKIVVAEEGEAFYRILDEGTSLRTLPTELGVRSRVRVLDEVSRQVAELGVLPRYQEALGDAYFRLAREVARPYPEIVLECLRKADIHLGRAPTSGSTVHRLLWQMLGLERKERLTMRLASLGIIRRNREPPETTGSGSASTPADHSGRAEL
jgi:O-antigen biosynthesis protein